MRCPKCNTQMVRVGLPELSGDALFVTMECPACHFRMQARSQQQGSQQPRKFGSPLSRHKL